MYLFLLLLLIFFFAFCFLFIFLFLFKKLNLILNEFVVFCKLFFLLLKSYLIKYTLAFILDIIILFYRIRFFLFFGSSYYDPLSKIFFDKFSSLKGELIMDFYNFSSKFMFENDFNMPLSIFSHVPIFEGARNFFFLKVLYNLFVEITKLQGLVRSFFFFSHGSNMRNNSNLKLSDNINDQRSSALLPPNLIFSNFFFRFSSFFLIIFNFFSFDFFLFLNFINIFLNQSSSSFLFKTFVLKYFAFLRSSFVFVLVNLENDSFLHYLHIMLYKLALRNYYTRSDWNNLINTYDLSLTKSFAFNGESDNDFFFILKITFFYFFIFFNYILFFLFCFLFCLLKGLFYLFHYFISFFFIDLSFLNGYFFFSNFFNLFFSFYFCYLNKIFIYYRNLFSAYFNKFFSKLIFLSDLLLIYSFDFLSFFCVVLLNLLKFIKTLWSVLIVLIYRKIYFNFFSFIKNKSKISFNSLYFFYIKLFSIPGGFKDFLIFFLNETGLFANSVLSFVNNNSIYVKGYKPDLLYKFFELKFFINYSLSITEKYYNFPFYRFLLFFRLLRSKVLFFVIFYNGLFKKLNLHNSKDFVKVFSKEKNDFYVYGKNMFFIDYFLELVVYYLLYPFFFFINLLKNFPFLIIFRELIVILFQLFFCFKLILNYVFFIVHLILFYFNFIIFYLFFFFVLNFLLSFFFLYFSVIVFFFFIGPLGYLFLQFFFFFRKILFSNVFFAFFYFFFKVNFCIFYFYLNVVSFLKSRNLGFLQILGIFFLVRNDLKKYDLIHTQKSYMLFSSLNTDFLVNKFLNYYFQNYVVSIPQFTQKDKLLATSLFDFKSFKFRFFESYKILNKFKVHKSKDKFLRIQLKNDLFPEFEYHKYLRSRNLRNLRLFRFRKSIEPVDFYKDPALDNLSNFNSNAGLQMSSNFDFLKIFYRNDFIFDKDLNFFRDVFSRKNLSFFYDNLEGLSQFRVRFGKLSPLFRYFYLKREKFKYILTMHTFGNVNSFSFSVVLNWLLYYRLLRIVLTLFRNSDVSFYSFSCFKPRFQLGLFFKLCDKIILSFNFILYFFLWFLCLFFIFYVYMSFFLFIWFLCFFLFILYKLLFFFNVLKNLNFYILYIYKKPFFFNIDILIASFLSPIIYLLSRRFYILKFGILVRFFFKFIFILFVFFFLLFFFKLDFVYLFLIVCMCLFSSYSMIVFVENNVDNLLVFHFLNGLTHEIFLANFILVDIFNLLVICFFFFSFYIFFELLLSKFLMNIYLKFDYWVIRLYCLFLFKFFKFYFLSFFSKTEISPQLLVKELDLLIIMSRTENAYIRTRLLKR